MRRKRESKRAGREFAVGHNDEFVEAIKQTQAVSDIWFN